MNKILASFLCAVIIAGSCPAPASEDVQRKEYVGRDMDGDRRWQGTSEVRKKDGDIYVLTEKAEGVYSSFNGPISWVVEMEFRDTGDTVRPLSMEKRVFDGNGEPLRVEKQNFDFTKNIATCSHQDIPKNTTSTKKFKFSKDIVNRQILGLYTQKLLAGGRKFAAVQMVSEEPGIYNIDLSVVRKETVDINGRKIRAYKILIDPRLGLLDVAKIFFPRSYAWHSAASGFEWLRYQGLEGDIRSEKVEVTTAD